MGTFPFSVYLDTRFRDAPPKPASAMSLTKQSGR
jgi:hypothetical protein